MSQQPPPALDSSAPSAMASSGAVAVRHHVRLSPRTGWLTINMAEIWHYRDLLWFLAVRDIKLRYKQTVLGVAWALLQPFTAMLIFSVFFGQWAKIPSDNVPYPVFGFVALLPWQLFAYSLTMSSNSVIENERLVSKVYFPRLLLPFASVLAGLVDFAVSFVLLLFLMLYYGIVPGWPILLLPFLVAFVVLAALSVGIWLSALNAQYRDFRYTVPFLVQIGFFLSPVVYSSSIVPEKYRLIFALNPMAGVIETFRWALLGQRQPELPVIAVSATMVVLLLIAGSFYFRRMERTMADWV